MDEDLQLLISHYEKEQQLLQSLLDEYLLEEDYKYANYYLKNLRLLKITLDKLYYLSDYNYAEKSEVLRRIKNLEKCMLKKHQKDYINDLTEKELKELNAKLSVLNEKPVIEVEEKHDIENAIIQLTEKDKWL